MLKRSDKLYLTSGGKARTSDSKGHTSSVKMFLKALDNEGDREGILTFIELYGTSRS